MKMTRWIVSASLVVVALLGAACDPATDPNEPVPGEPQPTEPTDPAAPPEDPAAPPPN